MNAIIKGIMITPENRDIINSTVEELISEKLKFEKFNEYKINKTIDEIKNFEESFYLEKNYTKGELFEALAENNIKYKYLENYFKTEVSWGKLIAGLYFRLASANEIEIDTLISKNPNINYEQARNIIIQRQLDLKSQKLLRDMLNEATIEYR